jgi:hypothetical protein
MGGQDGQLPTHVLADQLTLSETEGANCALHITAHAHPALGSFLHPCIMTSTFSDVRVLRHIMVGTQYSLINMIQLQILFN